VTIEVAMPQMGESLTEGTLVKWHKKAGDRVLRDEPLFEITTDKVDTEVPSPQDGYLLKILVQEGETVPVRTAVCLLSERVPDGDTAPAAAATSAALAPPPDAAASGPRAASRAAAQEAPAGATAGDLETRLRERSSPVVRRLAAEHGFDLQSIPGSGLHGRVTREDLQRHIEGRAGSGPGTSPGEDRIEPMSVVRQQIAEHMLLSRRTSAHVTSVFEVDMTVVRRQKEALATQFQAEHAVKLTYLPFIAQAVCAALEKHPALNAAIEGKNVRYHRDVNLGVAVAVDAGLIVPVLRQAQTRSLPQLAKGIQDLAEKARSRRLRPEDVQAGTFTLTNPGVFGSLIGTPIIHQPQVAILCVGAVTRRPVVVPDTSSGLEESEAIAIRSMAYFSLSFDHRLIDGATADRFLADVKARLEGWKHPE
jgi:2-oxoglutarate dehydrogenase E2 component (dihydrolipoamide succinyltransferase)